MIYQHQEFSVEMNLNIFSIQIFHVCERINGHTELILGGICLDSDNLMPIKQNVTIRGKDGSIFFYGVLGKLEIKKSKELLNFQLKAYSLSHEMDQKRKRRVFQNLDMTYEQVINEVIQSYKNASIIDKVTDGKKIPNCFVQFDETDWEFLKRLASHFNTGICVNCKGSSIQIFFGTGHGDSAESEGEMLSSQINLLRKQELVKIQTLKQSTTGSQVLYGRKIYLVESTEIFMQKGALVYQSILERGKDVSFPYISNPNIAGIHIWAVVREIRRNKLRVQYQMEDKAQGNTPFLPFAGEENNEAGYYMPEQGNVVEVTFPDSEEGHAFVSAAKRSVKPLNSAKSNMKYLRNREGLGLYMDEQELNVSAGMANTEIVMYRDGSVRIEAPESISINPGADLTIGSMAGTVTLQARNNIIFQSGITGGSRIQFDTSGNIICKALQRVVIRGSGIIPGGNGIQSNQSNTGKGGHEVRSAALALSGVEFLSQSATGMPDFQGAQKVMNHLIGKTNSEERANMTSGNLIKENLFQNDEKLFNSFSYGESKRG